MRHGCDKIISETTDVINGLESIYNLEDKIVTIEKKYALTSNKRKQSIIKAWEKAVDVFLDDGILDASEEERLVSLKDHFGLSRDDLDENGALTKIVKAAVIRDVLEGKIPQRVSVQGAIPINFQKSEKVVWVFPNSDYLEDKIRRQYVGQSKGVSIRVMKGVYYRVGAFKGHTVENTERVHIDTGLVVVTDKNIYFAGPQKSLRLPYKKIITFEPFSDGVGVMRDAATAKPQILVTGDGWFTYNLIANLAQL